MRIEKSLIYGALVFLLAVIPACGQTGFFRNYEFEVAQHEQAYDLHILEDGYLLVGLGGCEDRTCTFIMKTDFGGDTMWVRRYDEFYAHTRRTEIVDSLLYMPGQEYLTDGSREDDGFRLFKFDLEGNFIASSKYGIDSYPDPPVDSIYLHLPFGSCHFENRMVIYGGLYESEDTPVFSRGFMVWFNMDLSLDTMIYIQPRQSQVEIWNAQVGPDGLLTLLVDDDAFISGADRDYRHFEKYNLKGDKTWSSSYIELLHSRLKNINSHIMSNGDMITYYDDNNSLYSKKLVSVSPDGSINWNVRVDPRHNVDSRHIGIAMAESIDGNILLGGSYEGPRRRGSYVGKYDLTTGEMIWERVFQDWTDKLVLESRGLPSDQWVLDMEVDKEGNILAVGFNNNPPDDVRSDRDVLLLRLDSEGCIEEGCGGFKQTVAGTQRYYDAFANAAMWYYQHPEASDGIYRTAFSLASNTDDDFYQLIYRDWAMEVSEISSYIGGLDEAWAFFKLKKEGREIYQVVDSDTILLYDFTLEVGDIFESAYTPHTLEVVDSDTLILLNGEKRRSWTLSSSDASEYKLRWIEGIGTDHGFLWPPDFCAGDYGDVRLTCYYMFENLNYINEDIGGCRVTDTEDLYNAGFDLIQVTPNPTTDLVTITAPSDLPITRTELMDTQGQTQLRHHDNSTQVVYDLSGYPSGLYFISVHTEKGSVVKKVVLAP